MVNIAGTLPKSNGLVSYASQLAKALASGQKHFVVGVVVTESVKTKTDLDPVPTVKFTRIELVPLGHDLESPAADLMLALEALRNGGEGQQQFDMSAPGEPVEVGPLELESGEGMFFRVVDVEPGVFELRLCSPYLEGLRTRRMLRSEWGEVPPGDYQAAQFDPELAAFADRLLVDWNTNAGEAEVVDAEVIDDDEPADVEDDGDTEADVDADGGDEDE